MTRSTPGPASTERAPGPPLAEIESPGAAVPLWLREKKPQGGRTSVGRREAEALRRLRHGGGRADDEEVAAALLALAWGEGRWLECGCNRAGDVGPLLAVAYVGARRRYYVRRMTGPQRVSHAPGCGFAAGDALAVRGQRSQSASASRRPRLGVMLFEVLQEAGVGVRPGAASSAESTELALLYAAAKRLSGRGASSWAGSIDGIGAFAGAGEHSAVREIVIAHQADRRGLLLRSGIRVVAGEVEWDPASAGLDGPFIGLVERRGRDSPIERAFVHPVVSAETLTPVYSNEDRGLWRFAKLAAEPLVSAGLSPVFLERGGGEGDPTPRIGLRVRLPGRNSITVDVAWRGPIKVEGEKLGRPRFWVDRKSAGDARTVMLLRRFCFGVLRGSRLG